MTIHHLDCCPMHPIGRRLIDGTGGLFERATMVAHVLAIETSGGLVLVDTGIGTEDVRDPVRRLGRMFASVVQPELDERNTALQQIEALGCRPRRGPAQQPLAQTTRPGRLRHGRALRQECASTGRAHFAVLCSQLGGSVRASPAAAVLPRR